jgi:protein-S-isoprenylcysteine O-methyltransferase Ste14
VLIRHLLAIALLPFMVAVVVPVWLASRTDLSDVKDLTPGAIAVQFSGLVVGGAGLVLFATSLRQFATKGKGTLAPRDPPRHLVVEGPYRFVRNPMISGVLLVLIGEALILCSWTHAAWALLFFCINSVYIPLLEEPQLAARFGADYVEYRRHVRRLIPRLRPWTAQPLSRPTDRGPKTDDRQDRNGR